MQRLMCKSKIYGLKVTHKSIEYDGSIALPEDVLIAGDILPGEIVLVVNMCNGERFNTYVIKGKAGECGLFGGAARLGDIGDKLIVISYIFMSTDEAKMYTSKTVVVDENNKVRV